MKPIRSSSKVIVTGAGGALGRCVASRLSRKGFRVYGIGHGAWIRDHWSDYGMSGWRSSTVTVNELKRLCRRADLIVHCAGGSSVSFSNLHPNRDFAKTVSSSAAVLGYVSDHSPETRIVFPSSAAVYGQVKVLPIRETEHLQPVSPYGIHKLVSEEMFRQYARLFKLRITIVRLFSVYGEGLRKQLLWDACNKLTRFENRFQGTGDEVRDWIHLLDAADLMIMASEKACSECPVINGGSGLGLSVREILEELFQTWNSEATPVFDSRKRSGDPGRYQADISLANSLGWNPKVRWRDGVRNYVKWYKNDMNMFLASKASEHYVKNQNAPVCSI